MTPKHCIFLALGGLALIASTGCETTSGRPGASNPKVAPDSGVSVMPWNQPQGWENRGALGGFADQIGSR